MYKERRIKRRHLFFYLQISDVKAKKLLGYIVDISPQGFRVVSEDVCKAGLVYDLRMKIPDKMGLIKEINFKAKCAWSGLDANSDFYANGFELKNLSNDNVNSIEDIINEYGFEDLE